MNMGTAGKILVVDDNRNIRTVLRTNLQARGYSVTEAQNGHEALEQTNRDRPDVIVMDRTMPIMDGLEATRTLKSNPRTADIPILMVTAKASSEDVVEGIEGGADEYVSKPFDVGEVMARIAALKRAGDATLKLQTDNAGLSSIVMEKSQMLELLYRFARDLNGLTTRQSIMELVVRTAALACKSRRISILACNDDSRELLCEAALGIDPPTMASIRVQPGEGIAGCVFATQRTAVINSAEEWTRSSNRYETKAFLSVPLISTALSTSDTVLGVLNVTERQDGRPYCSEEVDCVNSIASAAAIALHSLMRRARLQESMSSTILVLARLAEYRDQETGNHLERVQAYTRLLANRLRLFPRFASQVDEEFVDLIARAVPMHDIGKVGIRDDILLKPGKLTDEEFTVMKTHVAIGEQILDDIRSKTGDDPFIRMCTEIAAYHHERYDGAGYLRGLRGEQIPLSARIAGLVDAYDAITSKRRYKPAIEHDRAIEIIRKDAGTHFDPALVEVLLGMEQEFDHTRGELAERDVEALQVAEPAVA